MSIQSAVSLWHPAILSRQKGHVSTWKGNPVVDPQININSDIDCSKNHICFSILIPQGQRIHNNLQGYELYLPR